MNYAFGTLWGAWVLFWLAFAPGSKPTATPVGLRWRFTALAAILVMLLTPAYSSQFSARASREAACGTSASS